MTASDKIVMIVCLLGVFFVLGMLAGEAINDTGIEQVEQK